MLLFYFIAHNNTNHSISVHHDAVHDEETQNKELQQLLATALERKDQTEAEKRVSDTCTRII